jgi:cytidine deaminase
MTHRENELIEAALKARARARAPYSQFQVGAAVLAGSGRIYTGCNVENASYGLTVCAERVALFKAVSEGESKFEALAVVTDAAVPATPCGACRQVIWELCGDIPVVLANVAGRRETVRMAELLPRPFASSFLGERQREK